MKRNFSLKLTIILLLILMLILLLYRQQNNYDLFKEQYEKTDII